MSKRSVLVDAIDHDVGFEYSLHLNIFALPYLYSFISLEILLLLLVRFFITTNFARLNIIHISRKFRGTFLKLKTRKILWALYSLSQ